MQVEIDDESLSSVIASELLAHAKYQEGDPKLQKALLRVAVYYMTYEQCVDYFGGKEEADEYFGI